MSLCIWSNLAAAQELKCIVKVNTPKLQTADPKIFQTLQKSIFEFMNNRKWTDDPFETAEKIECSIIINITSELGNDEYGATITLQSNRPAFNSSYTTTLLNFNDKDFVFQYVEYQPLEFNENNPTNNLTSTLAYYAYMILGIDYDTFSSKGGTAMYDKAKAIVVAMQNEKYDGWKPYEKNLKNRYWLNESYTNSRYDNLRVMLYQYHRLGIDVLYSDASGGRAVIMNCIKTIEKSYDENPNLLFLTVFLNAKADEMVGVFSEGTPQEKVQAQTILTKCDPINSQKYKKITGAR